MTVEFLSFLSGAGGAAVVAGIFKLAEWALTRKARKEDLSREQRFGDCKARGREISELKKMVEVSLIADRVLLYDRIKHLAKSYIAKGWVSVEEYEDLVAMHRVYHDEDKLNGNGFLNDIMRTVCSLEKRAQ